MKKYKGYILDLDGVVYKGENIIESAVQFINFEKKKGKEFYFLTNNSTKSRKEYREKLLSMKIESVLEKNIITSGIVTQRYLRKHIHISYKNKILCLAEEPVKKKLREIGYDILEPKDYKFANFVVVGETDFKREDLYYAVNAIKHYGAFFIGTNADIIDPVENGESKPVAGALLAYISVCTGIEAKVLGKPSPDMYDMVFEISKLKKEDLLMIGDRLDTDIIGAKDFGLDTVLVETGIHKRVDCELLEIFPTYIVKNLLELL